MKTKPNPSFLNTCILKDMRSFENLPYMMDEKLNLKPEFYDMVEWDECGNIVKVMGRKLIYVPMIWRLEKKDDGIKLPYDFDMDQELANLKQEVSNITYTNS
tara:strand:- start:3377 stop:3682 length:306 start_codon:yes stop_codon:yes gene_type:complete